MKILIITEIDDGHLLKEANDLYDLLKGREREMKMLPEKLHHVCVPGESGEYARGYGDGWNKCLEEIEND